MGLGLQAMGNRLGRVRGEEKSESKFERERTGFLRLRHDWWLALSR